MDCPICRKTMVSAKWQPGNLSPMICPSCNFVGLSLDNWSNPYTHDDYYGDSQDLKIHPDSSFIQNRIRGIKKFKTSGKVLELGCGKGETSIALNNEKYNVDAIDDSKNIIEQLKRKNSDVNWHYSSINEFINNIPDETYDLVLLYHVLEHIPYPGKICHEITRILKHGGVVIIEVPNFNGLHRKIWGDRWWYWIDHHVNYFTLKTLKKLLEPEGLLFLDVEKKYHFSHPQDVFWKDIVKGTLAQIGFADIICTYWGKK